MIAREDHRLGLLTWGPSSGSDKQLSSHWQVHLQQKPMSLCHTDEQHLQEMSSPLPSEYLTDH